jgi:hypothetical protein
MLKEWEFVKKEVRPEVRSIWRFLVQMLILKELLISFFVIVFITNPYLQVCPLLAMFSINIFALLKFKPLKDKE